jgi:hypothetical protein
MSRIQCLRFTVRLIVLLGPLSISMGSSRSSARAQDTLPNGTSSNVTFRVYDNSRSSEWPIKVTKLMLGDKEIPLNVPIQVEGHWLRSLRLIAQNVSSKNIVRAVAFFGFPETGKGTPDSPRYVTTSGFGKYPDYALFRADGTKIERPANEPAAALVLPGGIMTFSATTEVGDEDHQAEAYQKADGQITQVTIEFNSIYFSDNSKWMAETYFVPSSSIGRWDKAPAEQFIHKQQDVQ